jgi:hypothetical protein
MNRETYMGKNRKEIMSHLVVVEAFTAYRDATYFNLFSFLLYIIS